MARMPSATRVVGLLVTASLVALTAAPTAGWTAPAADAVLGQPDPTSIGCNQGQPTPSATSLCAPSDVVSDPTTGRLFVADTGNRRVMSWANTHQLSTGEPADLVLGQQDFESVQPCDSASEPCLDPWTITVDQAGVVYVSNEAGTTWQFAPPLATGEAPEIVSNSNSVAADPCGASPTTCHTRGVAADFRYDLFIADAPNSRVLRSSTQVAQGTQSSGGATGAVIVVTTIEDELRTDGNCSQREAIQAVNTSQPVDACPAGFGTSLIVLQAATYHLTAELETTGAIDLVGAGAEQTVLDATLEHLSVVNGTAPTERPPFAITNPNPCIERVSSAGCAYGSRGGGILNDGQLRLSDVLVSNNTSPGEGCFTPHGPGCPGEGGGISNTGTLVLTRARVTANVAGDGGGGEGGGIFNSGTLSVNESTVSGNIVKDASFLAQGCGPGDCLVIVPGIGPNILNIGEIT